MTGGMENRAEMRKNMREEILDGLRRHIQPVSGLEQTRIIEVSPGHSKIAVDITENALNLYGNVHGGFLFALCDTAAGMATYAYEFANVTLQGNINFIKGIKSGTLIAEANSIHKGKKTVINQVTVTDGDGTLIASASFSMFLFDSL